MAGEFGVACVDDGWVAEPTEPPDICPPIFLFLKERTIAMKQMFSWQTFNDENEEGKIDSHAHETEEFMRHRTYVSSILSHQYHSDLTREERERLFIRGCEILY